MLVLSRKGRESVVVESSNGVDRILQVRGIALTAHEQPILFNAHARVGLRPVPTGLRTSIGASGRWSP